MTAVVLASPGPLFIDPNRQVVQSNGTITSSGNATFSGYGTRELVLVINLTVAPTGTSPTITWSMQEVDPGNGSTTLGSSTTGATLNSATTQILTLPLTQTGDVLVSWTVTGTSPSFTGVYATLLSRSTTVLSALDGTGTEHAVLVDSSGRTLIVGAGTSGTPAGGVVSIQGVSGGQPVPISGSISLSGSVNQGTANTLANAWPIEITDGTHGPSAVKPASTAAVAADPSLVVAFSPNSPIPSGSNVIGAVTQSGGPWSVSGTVTVQQSTPSNLQGEVGGLAAAGSAPVGNPVQIGGWDGTDIRILSTDPSGHAVIVGDGTAGTPAGGVVSIQGVSGGTAVPISGSITASGTVTANQGTANTVANSWPTEITDGTHGPAAVKAASTAAAAADPSLVVALSPNSPIPSGSNVIGAVTQSGAWTVTATSATASNFLAEVGGLGSAGSAPVGNPVQIGGSDGTNIHTLLTDSSGRQEVVGAAASGAAVTGNPVLIAGSDGTDARTISTDVSGHPIIVGDGTAGSPAGGVVSIQGVSGGTSVPISGSVTASGTVTSNQGTANTIANSWPMEITDGTHGPSAVKAASTAAAATDPSLVVALSPNSPLPAGSNIVGAVTQSGSWAVTVTQATASNLLAEVGGLGAAGSALVGNPVQIGGSDGTNTRTILTDTSGRPEVVGAAANGLSVTGNPVLVAGSDGTNARSLSTDSGGHAIIVGDGTAGSPAGGVVSIQGVSGGTAIPVSGTVTATNPSIGTTGSTTPTSATLVGGTDGTNLVALKIKDASTAAVAADPSLVVAFSPNSPLPSGANIIGAVTQSGTWGVTATYSDTLPATQAITAQDTGSSSTTGANGQAFVTGSPTAGSTATFTISSIDSIKIQVTGTWTGTLTLESSLDGGTTWFSTGIHQSGTSYQTNGFTANFIGGLNMSGCTNFRVRATAAWTGTATVKIIETVNTNTVYVGNPIFLHDGTTQSTLNTIKAASTAAVATDTALVVAPSPNSAGPTFLTTPNELANSPSIFATNFPAGFLRTSDEPTQLLYDPFDGSVLDTTNNWQAPVSAGGGVGAAVSGGSLTLGTGTTANGYSYLQSQNNFRLTIPSWMGLSHALQTEYPVTANTYRFWGQGTVPATPTASSKTTAGNSVTNGIGWELGTDGKLLAVVWASGTRTIIQDLSSATGNGKQPTDGLPHRYICYIRTDKIFWYLDSLDVPVATSSFQSPTIQTLPDLFLAIAGSTTPGSSGVITCLGVANWDTGKNNVAISDGTYGWRKSTIKPASTAAVAVDSSLVVGLSPNSPLPTGSNIIGAVTQSGTWTDTVTQATAANLNALVAQGASASLANAWTTKITDGTNGPAAVKAGSTQSVNTDPALVVALHPASAQTRASTSAVTTVSSTTTSTAILTSSSARLGAFIVNNSTAILYLLYGTGTASNAAGGYSVSVAISGGVHEVFAGYTGQINGIWAAANGYCNITSLSV